MSDHETIIRIHETSELVTMLNEMKLTEFGEKATVEFSGDLLLLGKKFVVEDIKNPPFGHYGSLSGILAIKKFSDDVYRFTSLKGNENTDTACVWHRGSELTFKINGNWGHSKGRDFYNNRFNTCAKAIVTNLGDVSEVRLYGVQKHH